MSNGNKKDQNKIEFKEKVEKQAAKESMVGFCNYLGSGESLELVDGENMRIHDQELTILMEDFIHQLKIEANQKDIKLFIIT